MFEVYGFEVDAAVIAKLNLDKAGGRVRWLETTKGTAIVFHVKSKHVYPTEKPGELQVSIFLGPSEDWITDLISVGGDPEKMSRHLLWKVDHT